MPLRTRIAVAVTGAAVALAGCGSSSSAPTAQGDTSSNHHGTQRHASAGATDHGHKSDHSGGTKTSSGRHPAESTSSLPSRTLSGQPPSTDAGTKHQSGSSSPASTGPAPIAPGTYTYDQTGSQTISGFHSSVPPTSTLVVHPAKANGRQTSRMSSGDKQPPSDQTVLFNRKGMFLISQVERVAIPGRTETIRCTFHPGVPYPPWPVEVGQKVHAHTDCGQVKVTATGSVVGRRTATIGGKTLTVYVINTTLTTSGQASSTSHDTEWFSPDLRLSVRDTGTITGKFGPFSFNGTFTRTLSSTTPR